MLVTGRSKLFLRRDTVFPPYEKMALGELSPFTLGEIKLDLTLGWDGTNEEVAHFRAGWLAMNGLVTLSSVCVVLTFN